MRNSSPFNDVIETLMSEEDGLRVLAERSGFDPFRFYQGADLSGLDLSGQDLKGLNFERAILVESNLEGVSFDKGAFNGAVVSQEYANILDEFDFFMDDVFSANRFNLYYFGRFRNDNLERAISKSEMYYEDFASLARINPQTLRKARRGEIVSHETVTAICSALLDSWEQVGFDDLLGGDADLRQPFIQFLDLLPKGKFEHIPRLRFREVYRSEIISEQKNGPISPKDYRSTFAIESWFRENDYLRLDGGYK